MKKKVLVLIAIFIMLFAVTKVSALNTYFSYDEIKLLADDNCKALFGDPTKPGHFAYYLQTILNVMKYAGIVLLIVLTVVEFFKALISDDKDLLKPLTKKTLRRIIYAVLLFFLPIIVKMLLTLIDVYGTCGIS